MFFMTCRQTFTIACILFICLAEHTVFSRDEKVYSESVNKTQQMTSYSKRKTEEDRSTLTPATENLNPVENLNVPNKTVAGQNTTVTGNYTETAVYNPKWLMNIDSGALQRTGLVALGIMSVLLFFFVIRAVSVRHKKSKGRKYGVITSTASDIEMEPLDQDDDDDEDTTLFDAQHKYRIK